ncbi:MAG: alpha/beta hydrolase [Chitinophagaceae bacterium]
MNTIRQFRKLLYLLIAILTAGAATAQPAKFNLKDLSDAALVKKLPGFSNETAEVNGIRLHYVTGGKGDLVVLLPGWPETWWSFSKIMPVLSQQYKVVSVDIRGMGSSDKPDSGYEKKNMAKDVYELVRKLGYSNAYVIGHDIGAQVAFSFAANYPAATKKLVLLDVPHPDESWFSLPLLPQKGTFSDELDEAHPYLWWFAFHQVKGMPEQILEGRAQLEHEWFFKYLAYDEKAISAFDRAVYAAAYNQKGGVRAGNAWYQAFAQDIVDNNTYGKLDIPVIGIAGPGYGWLNAVLPVRATDWKVVRVEGSGHFVVEERPEATVKYILDFLK